MLLEGKLLSISPSLMLAVFEREGLCRRCSVSNQRLYLRFEFLAMKIVTKTPTISGSMAVPCVCK